MAKKREAKPQDETQVKPRTRDAQRRLTEMAARIAVATRQLADEARRLDVDVECFFGVRIEQDITAPHCDETRALELHKRDSYCLVTDGLVDIEECTRMRDEARAADPSTSSRYLRVRDVAKSPTPPPAENAAPSAPPAKKRRCRRAAETVKSKA